MPWDHISHPPDFYTIMDTASHSQDCNTIEEYIYILQKALQCFFEKAHLQKSDYLMKTFLSILKRRIYVIGCGWLATLWFMSQHPWFIITKRLIRINKCRNLP